MPARKESDPSFRLHPSLRELFDAVDAAGLPFPGCDVALVLPVLQRVGPDALRAWQYFCRRASYHCMPSEINVAHFILRQRDWIEWSAPADITQAWR